MRSQSSEFRSNLVCSSWTSALMVAFCFSAACSCALSCTISRSFADDTCMAFFSAVCLAASRCWQVAVSPAFSMSLACICAACRAASSWRCSCSCSSRARIVVFSASALAADTCCSLCCASRLALTVVVCWCRRRSSERSASSAWSFACRDPRSSSNTSSLEVSTLLRPRSSASCVFSRSFATSSSSTRSFMGVSSVYFSCKAENSCSIAAISLFFSATSCSYTTSWLPAFSSSLIICCCSASHFALCESTSEEFKLSMEPGLPRAKGSVFDRAGRACGSVSGRIGVLIEPLTLITAMASSV
mmetsp:Transcript_38230/g.83163  ORF Transcript_38230/g.83163 Transcript_38230/m.83163 type:complete len:302 (-) Transcript_38230:566-1471(-)